MKPELARTERVIARMNVVNVAVTAAAIAIAIAGWDLLTARDVGFGALVGTANFWGTAFAVRQAVTPEGVTPRRARSLVTRIGGLFLAVGSLIWWWKPESLPFGAGFLAVLAAVTVSGIVDAVGRMRSEDEDVTRTGSGGGGDDRN